MILKNVISEIHQTFRNKIKNYVYTIVELSVDDGNHRKGNKGR